MTLLFDDTKKLEKAVGPEAAEVIAKIFEGQDEAMRKDLATKADLELKLAETKADLIKWVAGMLVAQSAIIAALVKLLAK
jgi:phosphoribosyl-ATP pyrophosphohydrolase